MPTGSTGRPASSVDAPAGALSISDGVLLDALAAMAAARSRVDVATAACAVLLELEGVRGAAVLEKGDGAAVVIGSAGYGCDTMGAGARLPLDSGLPAVTALRTGQLVQQGTGPSWVAAPFGRRTPRPGVLLLSLTGPPPATEADLVRVQRLATEAGAALARAEQTDATAEHLAAVLAGWPTEPVGDDDGVAIRQTARGGSLGGDVAMTLPDRRGRWLIAADVSGAGLGAASRAAAVRTAVRALASSAEGPAHLLELLDRTLRPETPEDGFVTAVAVLVQAGSLRSASAGHLCPVLVTREGAVPLPVEPGQPLCLQTETALVAPMELITRAPAGAVLVLYSDGLVDRRTADGEALDISALLADLPDSLDPAAVAETLLAAADAVGPADDDTTVLVTRV